VSFASHRRLCDALAITAYLAIALLAFRNVLASPSTLLPYPSVINDRMGMVFLDHWDQSMVIGTVIRNARLLVTRPWDLFADVGQCFPMPRAYTLGEHMFGVGFLAAVPYALTRDPILSFNVASILTLWIPGITMYFLSLRFTRSPAAAFVAGLAFVLVPGRLIDPSHPYVHGDLWAPGVLLFLHRLFVSARWRDALGLAFFLNLEVFESLYPLLSTSLFATTYGVYLLARHRGALTRVLPRLAGALALGLVGVWLVLVPYLETSATWGLLAGRTLVLLSPRAFLPGGDYFPGYVVLALVAAALLDRLRGPRLVHGEDPRWIFATAGILIAWSALSYTPIPPLGFGIESPFVALRGIIPGLEAVRALSAIALGSGIATAFLAGYGVVALSERLRPVPWAPAAGAALCATAILAMRFVPGLAEASFGRSFRLTTYEARPPQEDIDLLRSVGRGPLIELPLGNRRTHQKRLDVAGSLLLASYDPRPLGACYNSFYAPVNRQVVALAEQLPQPAAAEALAALGFETIFLNRHRAGPVHARAFEDARARDPESARRLVPLGETATLAAFRLAPQDPTDGDLDLLQPSASGGVLHAVSGRAVIDFPIVNRGPATFRLAGPLRPTPLLLRWYGRGGDLVLEQKQQGLLPIAVGAGGEMSLSFEVTTPDTPGEYLVTLARADDPHDVIGRRQVYLPRLEELMGPAEIALHVNKPFVDLKVLPSGFDTLSPPEDEAELLLGPGIEGAAEIRSHGRLAAHWFNLDGVVSTTAIETRVRPGGADGFVRARVPVPDGAGVYLVLLTPAGDPRTLLAGRAVVLDTAATRPGSADETTASP